MIHVEIDEGREDVAGAPLHRDDFVHVLLDALQALQERIDDGERPWRQYTTSPADDPKASEAGYLALMARATTELEDTL
jgi:hypothetical protein